MNRKVVYRKRNKKPRSANLAPKTANAVKKIVKYELNKETEDKQYVVGVTTQAYFGTTAQATANMKAMVTPAQGIADNQRIGDTLRLKKIQLRISFFNNNGATSNIYNFCRLVIFQYKSPISAVAPDMANMFLTGAGTGQVNIYSQPNRDNKETYHILYDKVFLTVGGLSTGSSIASNYAHHAVVNVPLKFAQKTINFNVASTSATNQILFVVLGEQGSVGLNPYYTADWDVRYTDA